MTSSAWGRVLMMMRVVGSMVIGTWTCRPHQSRAMGKLERAGSLFECARLNLCGVGANSRRC